MLIHVHVMCVIHVHVHVHVHVSLMFIHVHMSVANDFWLMYQGTEKRLGTPGDVPGRPQASLGTFQGVPELGTPPGVPGDPWGRP